MATATIDVGNVYITAVDGGSVATNTLTGDIIVKIQTTSVDYDYTNAISVIPIPVAPDDRENDDGFTRVIDLKRKTESLNISGYLEDETTERAITKRNNLLTLANSDGSLLVVWGQGNYRTIFTVVESANLFGMFIQKMNFKETGGILSEGDYTGDPAPDRNIAVTIGMVRGKDI